MDAIESVKEEIEDELKEKNNDRGVLDIITEKAISRKFLVWVIATTLLATGKIDADNWVSITLGYVGIEGFADLAVKWKGANK